MSEIPAPWWRHLRGDPSRFLLSDDEPGVVWRCQVDLLGRPPDSPAVLRARAASRSCGLAAAILDRQEEGGYWGSPFAYGLRWSGTAWQVMALAGLGADPEDPRVRRGVDVLLDVMTPAGGGFAPGRGQAASACFTAQLCAAMARLGFAHEARVREAVGWLMERDGGRGGWSCPDLRHLVEGGCPVAAVGALDLVAELPPGERRQLQALSSRAWRWLAGHRLFLAGPAPRGWWRFAQPCLGRTDLVEALAVLGRAGAEGDACLAEAVLAVLSRQEAAGRWVQQLPVPMGEAKGEPGRWVTLRALVAVAAYSGMLGGGE